jgi:uncharacterized membrane protein
MFIIFFIIFLLQQTKKSLNINFLNQQQMKRFLALTIVGIALATIVASCGSSKGGHCDAYGSVNQVENSDLASK